MMGDEFSTSDAPSLKVKLKGTSKFAKVVIIAKVLIIKNGDYVYSTAPNTESVDFYYVRGEQDNGEIVWASPMWITCTGK